MTKKILAILVVFMVFASLFGCKAAATPTEAPTTAPVAQPTNTQAPAAPAATVAQPTATTAPAATVAPTKQGPAVMLDFYMVGNADTPERAAVEKAIDAYIEPLINADVTIHIIGWGDWTGKAMTALQAGEKMDIIFTADWEGYMQEVTQGLVVPLNDDKGPDGNLLKQYGQGITSSLNPAFLTGSAINGINYAIPTNKELSVPWGFVYNATVADKIGFTDADAAAVKSAADMEPWLAKAKAAYPDMYPYLTDGTLGYMQWVHAFTGLSDMTVNTSAIPDASGKVDETIMEPIATPFMKDYLTTIRSWYTKKYIDPDAGLTTFDTSKDLNAGKFFIEPMPLKGNNIKAQELMTSSGNKDLKLKEIYGMPKVINTSDAGGSMLAIAKSSPNPVAAMKLLNLMHTDKTLINMFLFGVKGTNWTLDADGRVNLVDDGWYKANPGPWVWADVTLQYVTNQQDPKTNQMLIDYAKDAFPEPSLGFRFVPDPVAAEITAITAVISANERALMTGYVDPVTALPKYLTDLKNAGLDKVIAEVQKQYTAWKATQK